MGTSADRRARIPSCLKPRMYAQLAIAGLDLRSESAVTNRYLSPTPLSNPVTTGNSGRSLDHDQVIGIQKGVTPFLQHWVSIASFHHPSPHS
jgi:hypothetical protein